MLTAFVAPIRRFVLVVTARLQQLSMYTERTGAPRPHQRGLTRFDNVALEAARIIVSAIPAGDRRRHAPARTHPGARKLWPARLTLQGSSSAHICPARARAHADVHAGVMQQPEDGSDAFRQKVFVGARTADSQGRLKIRMRGGPANLTGCPWCGLPNAPAAVEVELEDGGAPRP